MIQITPPRVIFPIAAANHSRKLNLCAFASSCRARLIGSTSLQKNMKRKPISEGSNSAPPAKRKIDSTTTSWSKGFLVLSNNANVRVDKAVSNFFKPASQREQGKIRWRVVSSTLLVGSFGTSSDGPNPYRRRKIAAFDFVSIAIRRCLSLLTSAL